MPTRQGLSYVAVTKPTRLRLWGKLRGAGDRGSVRALTAVMTRGLCLGLLAVGLIPHPVAAVETAAQPSNPSLAVSVSEVPTAVSAYEAHHEVASHPKRACFGQEPKSRDTQQVADWVVDSGDNLGLTFAIIDKVNAKVFVFDADGRLLGAAPVLLGLARGDESIPGIGQRKLSEVRPEERTTPAGRFVAAMGYDPKGKEMLWVDYESSVGLHRVVTTKPAERRLERLATPTATDNRISYGCINVPANFFDSIVLPAFTGTSGIVYVLPDTRSIREVFKSYYDVELRRGAGTAANRDETLGPGAQQQDLRIGRHEARP